MIPLHFYYQSASVKGSQVSAYPQAQPRAAAAALQSVAIELRELVEHPRLVFQYNACTIQSGREQKGNTCTIKDAMVDNLPRCPPLPREGSQIHACPGHRLLPHRRWGSECPLVAEEDGWTLQTHLRLRCGRIVR